MKLRRLLSHHARARHCGWLWLGLTGCSTDTDGVGYERDVRPIFARSCVPCHHSGNTNDLVDIEDPFTPEDGLVGSVNEWWKGHMDANPMHNVVPYEPDPGVSFLLEKITNTDLLPANCPPDGSACRIYDAGVFMPPRGRLLPIQIQAIREWIELGALETEATGPDYPPGTYSCPDQDERGSRQNAALRCVSRILWGSCRYCHYAGSPDPPNFEAMFDPVEGLIGKPSAFRGDINLVEPGNPNASFLVMKIEGRGPSEVGRGDPNLDELAPPSSEIGAPMPREYQPLSDTEVAVIRQWIAEGAKDN
jgi:hypothetical protein